MRKFQAIAWALFTVFIAIIGFSGYSDGSSYMEWFGMKLSETEFLWLIVAFVVSDIFVLVAAFRKSGFAEDKFVENMKMNAEQIAAESTELEAPCAVLLKRTSNLIGAALGVRVFLNGVEQGVLKNGNMIMMQTVLDHNELTVRYNGNDSVRTLNFDAKSGGYVRIKLKYIKVQLTIEK
ncbi:MAG: hypothetical protein LBL07_03635 [Tannerella sp.]|jgi:hypothetical protein|nr:hypothetical protein [Tannerella sp.]